MSAEENKAIIRRYIEEAWNKGNVNIIDQVMADNYARYIPGPELPLDREGQKQRIRAFRLAFPDFHLTIDDMVAEGDKVAFRMTGTGTQHGTFMGIAPTGRQTTITIIDIARFASGKIVEHWGNRDELGMLLQLGVIIPPR
jgi:predicted ester cyclase